jgi:4-hydroxy-2-oxoheptanedioate aldolase
LRERCEGVDGWAVGTWVTLPCAAIVEISAGAGYDFVIVDMEHSSVTEVDLENMARAGDASGISVLVRLRNRQREDIMAALDTGVHGVLAPMVESVAVAEQVVSAVCWPPLGTRGSSPHSRAAGYSIRSQGGGTPFCGLEIETLRGIDVVEDIIKIPGLDMIFIGPSDLRLSLLAAGVHESVVDDQVASAINRVIGFVSSKTGPILGVPANHPKLRWNGPTCRAKGVRLATVGSDVEALGSGLSRAISIL